MVRSRAKRLLIILIVVFLSSMAGGIFGVVAAYLRSAPSLDQVQFSQNFTTYIYDVNGRLITDLFRENRIPVSIDEVPEHLKNAVIAIEDDQFYNHHGINFTAIPRAVIVNIQERRFAQGFSTITMQLARNVFLTHDKQITRKLEELLWTIQIERRYAKDEILEAYLNEVYLNHGAYGVEAGARVFFGKCVQELTLSESALLAGVIRWPARYSPFANYDIAIQRRDFVLGRMAELGFITPEEAARARAEDLDLSERQRRTVNAPYFVDYILADLIRRYGEQMVFGGGLRVYTTLDLAMQEAAEKALLAGLPTGFTDANGLTQPQGAIIALDPRNGHIRAMVGGRGEDKFNRAAQAVRPPGSAFKIFGYTAAIDTGLTAGDVYEDEPVTFRLSSGSTWAPVNYGRTFSGTMTVREALELSTNTIAAQIVSEVGYAEVMGYAKQMGITTLVERGRENDLGPAPMALGGLTEGVSPLELATAYGVLANQGILVEPQAIVKVTDPRGRVLYENSARKDVVLSEQTAYLMTDILRGVIERGTGTNASIGRPAAGKTGTHYDHQDAWFVGYTPELVACVWFGADTPQRMLFDGVRYGSWRAASIWGDFASAALADAPVLDFARPDGIIDGVRIDTQTGLLVREGTAVPQDEIRTEIYVRGTEPTEYSSRCTDSAAGSWWGQVPASDRP